MRRKAKTRLKGGLIVAPFESALAKSSSNEGRALLARLSKKAWSETADESVTGRKIDNMMIADKYEKKKIRQAGRNE